MIKHSKRPQHPIANGGRLVNSSIATRFKCLARWNKRKINQAQLLNDDREIKRISFIH